MRFSTVAMNPWTFSCRPRAAVLLSHVTVLTLLGACGDGGSASITFDDTSPDGTRTDVVASSSPTDAAATSSPPIAPTSVEPRLPSTAEEWVDVTANLVGLDSECGNLAFVSGRPDRDAVIVGVADQGLWVSEDGATEWSPLGRPFGVTIIDNRATSIVYDPADPRRYWESGIYGIGVFETNDDGATFEARGNVAPSDLVSVDFSDPERRILLSGSHESRNLYRSSDGGRTWSDVSADLPPNVGNASFPHVLDATTHLIGTRTGADSGVFRTTDGGSTWSSVHPGGVAGAPLVSRLDGTIFWLLDSGGGVIASRDAGQTWTELLGWGPVGGSSASLLELPDGSLATLGTSNVLVSADRGVTWRAIGPNLPYAPTGLTYSSQRGAFYIWRFTCDPALDRNPVTRESIMRLDVDIA